MRLAWPLLLAAALLPAQTGYRMTKALSGPSGKVEGSKYAFDEVRSNFTFPKDKEVVVYFEWEGAPGKHHLTGIWKDPSGKTVQISEIDLEAKDKEFAAFWVFAVVADMMPGVWELNVRIDGNPAGSHIFNLSIPPPPKAATPAKPAERAVPTLDALFQLKRSVVWVDKLDGAGRREDRSTGFVSAANLVTTAFQSIDGATELEIEFADGRRVKVASVADWNRLEDWAVLAADTAQTPPLARVAGSTTPLGERYIVFNVENDARVIGGVDYTGRDQIAGFGARYRLNPSPAKEAAGGPLLDKYGDVAGVLGGSLAPGSRIAERALAVNPMLFSRLYGGMSATPVEALPATVQAKNAPLLRLVSQGVFTPALEPHPNFKMAATAARSDPFGAADAYDFSRRDPLIHVYALLEETQKAKNATISARIFDAQNRSLTAIAPVKVKWAGKTPVRWSAKFSPAALRPGIYRIDYFLNDQTVWRTFFRIKD